MWLATPVLTLIRRGPIRSLLLGPFSLWLLGSLLLGHSDLRLLEGLLLPRSHHLLLLLTFQGLKQGLLSLLGGRSALQTKTTIKYIK
jgi:hypothetical protein